MALQIVNDIQTRVAEVQRNEIHRIVILYNSNLDTNLPAQKMGNKLIEIPVSFILGGVVVGVGVVGKDQWDQFISKTSQEEYDPEYNVKTEDISRVDRSLDDIEVDLKIPADLTSVRFLITDLELKEEVSTKI